MQRLGSLLAGVSGPGLGPTLTLVGLGEMVGQSRFDVMDELVTLIAGTGGDLDAQAARDAACDVLEELFGDAATWDDLVDVGVTAQDIRRLLEMFLVRYVYNRVPVIAERLGQLQDPGAIQQADEEMRQVVEDLVVINMPGDPLDIDWSGAEGREIADAAIRSVYDALAETD